MNKRLLALATLAAIVASSVWGQTPPPGGSPFEGGFPTPAASQQARDDAVPLRSGEVERRRAGAVRGPCVRALSEEELGRRCGASGGGVVERRVAVVVCGGGGKAAVEEEGEHWDVAAKGRPMARGIAVRVLLGAKVRGALLGSVDLAYSIQVSFASRDAEKQLAFFSDGALVWGNLGTRFLHYGVVSPRIWHLVDREKIVEIE